MVSGKSYTGDRLKAGLRGEAMALNFLDALKDTIQSIDVSLDTHYQSFDIDYICMCKDSKVMLVECKCDSYIASTQNVVFEIDRIYHNEPPHKAIRPGWSSFSKATLLTVWSEDNQTLYVMTLHNLRKSMQEYTKNRPRLKVIDSDHYYSTLVILIPLDKILHNTYLYKGGDEWEQLANYGLFNDPTRYEDKATKGDHYSQQASNLATSSRQNIATLQKVRDYLPILKDINQRELKEILNGQ